jgi:hypothetical protein
MVVEVGVWGDEAGDRVGVVGKTEVPSGGSPKDGTVGEIEGGGGDETRGKERG